MARLSVEQARSVVLLRDGICMARILDPGAGPCGDRFGLPLTRYSGPGDLELDRIREVQGGRPGDHTDPFRMVAVCPLHHRGVGDVAGRVWATQKGSRAILREYLDRSTTQEKTRRLLPAL